ncbi:hypothetical protein [Thiosulfativibrio zosterae]|uniref:DUF72 domain-containing protein n=1 Tax=Thiosulfativibrio zosterae TaxID=2675053 RepID=A0A6F8PM76_9GAMM|nr:hypothetical protein [Thiosulfativibrio zosterae]BBP43212.1 hypothetical protein THMIRHAT_09580 [Thiosulfativibrio zosterae]
MENLTVGSFGWDRAEWQEIFYPEDLPSEWCLDFYSNEFHCVLIPQTEWLAWSDEEFESVLESIEGQTFALYFAVQTALDASQQKQLLRCHQKFYQYEKGVVFWQEAFRLPSGCEDFSQTLLQKLDDNHKTEEFEWSWTFDGWRLSGIPLGLVFKIPSDGKEQAKMIKSFVESLPKDQVGAPFILGDLNTPLEIQDLRAIKTIAELLGY